MCVFVFGNFNEERGRWRTITERNNIVFPNRLGERASLYTITEVRSIEKTKKKKKCPKDYGARRPNIEHFSVLESKEGPKRARIFMH